MKHDIQEIKDFIKMHPTAKIYLGADSQRIKKKRVKFVTVVVVHFDGHCGAKVFHEITYDKIQDAKLSRPFNRMMKEVQLVTDLYTSLEDVLIDRDFEVHLDVSSDSTMGSSVAYQAAKGMIFGYIGIEPICKSTNPNDPFPFAASCVADRYSK